MTTPCQDVVTGGGVAHPDRRGLTAAAAGYRLDPCATCGAEAVIVSEVYRPAVPSIEPGPWLIALARCRCAAPILLQRRAPAGRGRGPRQMHVNEARG